MAHLEEALNLYNQHANKFATAAEARTERDQSASIPLKRFHNQIKRGLLERFAAGKERVLDLACGRGGDIRKWFDCQIQYVKGIDLSPGEIEEARKRFEDTQQELYQRAMRKGQAKGAAAGTQCDFEASNQLGLSEFRDPGGAFDAVSCMFALHYFFADERTLRTFLHNVSINLRPGGHFFGTVPDGKMVNHTLQPTFPRGLYNGKLLRLEARWSGKAQAFGSAYNMAIKDSVTQGHTEDAGGSYEFLVYWRVLERVAADFGLMPRRTWGDNQHLDRGLDPADAQRGFKRFRPPVQQDLWRQRDVDGSLAIASGINAAFVFEKTGTSSLHLPMQIGAEMHDGVATPALQAAPQEQIPAHSAADRVEPADSDDEFGVQDLEQLPDEERPGQRRRLA